MTKFGNIKILVTTIFLLLAYKGIANDLVSFSVQPVEGAGIAIVPVVVEGLDYNQDDGRLTLFVKEPEKGEYEVPSQLETGSVSVLWFMFDHNGGEREYTIRKVRDTDSKENKEGEEVDAVLRRGGVPVLAYNSEIIDPPDGVDRLFGRSAYIHPLWSPSGEVLTRIQPPDHYHHYGIWNPWTSVMIGDNEVDFWNLGKGEGTVKFSGFVNSVSGNIYEGIQVLHEHVAFGHDGQESIAINEVWDIRVWDPGTGGIMVADMVVNLNTPISNGLVLNAYRYGGGIGFRATEKWHRENSTVLTSEGKVRDDSDGTNARWCIVEGESSAPEGRSGILFLSHPSNRQHPEPMRVWPPDANSGRGDMFFQFCPIRHHDWRLDHGRNYTLKYRMVIFDGEITAVEAEKHWKSFARLPQIQQFRSKIIAIELY